MKIKYSSIIAMLLLCSQFSFAQSVHEQVKKQAVDSANKTRAAKADVYIMDKTIISNPAIAGAKSATVKSSSKTSVSVRKHKKKWRGKSSKNCKATSPSSVKYK